MKKAKENTGQLTSKIKNMFTLVTAIGTTTIFLVITGSKAFSQKEINNAIAEIFKTKEGIKEIVIQDQQGNTKTYVYESEKKIEEDTTTIGIQENDEKMEGGGSCLDTNITSLNPNDTAYITIPAPNDSITITTTLGRLTNPIRISPSNNPTIGNTITITAQQASQEPNLVWRVRNQIPPPPFSDAYVRISFDILTGVTENNKTAITVFPNPATDIINLTGIEEGEEFEVKIFDMTGKEVIHQKNQEHIDVSNLKSGVYTVRIATKDRTVVRKIIKAA